MQAYFVVFPKKKHDMAPILTESVYTIGNEIPISGMGIDKKTVAQTMTCSSSTDMFLGYKLSTMPPADCRQPSPRGKP